MKKFNLITYASVFFSILFTSNGFCEQIEQTKEGQKIYLDSNNVFLSNHGITWEYDNEYISVDCLLIDENGIYTLLPEIQAWVCDQCGSTNPNYANVCYRCHRDKP